MALFQPNSYTSTLSKWSLDDYFPIKDYLLSLSGQTISWEDGKSSIPTKKSSEWFKMADYQDQKSSNLFIHQNLSHGQKSHQVKYIPWSLVMLIYHTLSWFLYIPKPPTVPRKPFASAITARCAPGASPTPAAPRWTRRWRTATTIGPAHWRPGRPWKWWSGDRRSTAPRSRWG